MPSLKVYRNQREFEDNIGGTLQDLCTNGALGPAEMILFASFRNSAGELVTIAYARLSSLIMQPLT
jgi:hypothetical protein